ncbi:MAG: TIGR03546 family protein [Nitrospina sp.]|nr:MAG: TIGR03546 family protein [Nitrospina sp.]
MLRRIIKVLKALNSNEAPWQISLGIIFGALLGLTPLFSLHNLVVLFLALFINLNISMMIVSFAAFSLIAYALDPVFHQVGLALLTLPGLESFWMQFFSCPVFLFANLNNTIVMGSLISTLAVSVPLFFLLNLLVVKYRHVYNTFIGRFPVLKFLKVLDVYEKAS